MTASIFRIHPAIGMARVGNSPEFYLGPETMAGRPVPGSAVTGGLPIRPGTESDTITSDELRDAPGGAMKRQAARFRVFCYPRQDVESYPNGQGVEVQIGTRVGDRTVRDIVWTVHLANKKANNFVAENPSATNELLIAGYEDGNLPPVRNPDGAQPPDPLQRLNDPARIRRLTIDPGPRTISGANSAAVAFDRGTQASWFDGKAVRTLPDYPKSFPQDSFPDIDCPIETLGELRTDGQGRLLVVGAFGKAGAWTDPTTGKPHALSNSVDNDGWFDDTADGPVSATLVFDDGSSESVQGAWVVSTDPSYAPQILNVVSLWDDLYDAWVRELALEPGLCANGAFLNGYRPSFPDQIQPIFRSAALQRWVTNLPDRAVAAHDAVAAIAATDDPDDTLLQGLGIIRDPNAAGDEAKSFLMPLALGDNGQALLSPTRTQYFFLSQWAGKTFDPGAGPRLGPGEALDKAVLVNCLGGRFSPGIDMTFIIRQPELWLQDWQRSGAGPFRIHAKTLDYASAKKGQPLLTRGYVPLHPYPDPSRPGLEPGDTSKFMAVPWHADYNSCATHKPSPNPGALRTLYWSWPAQRPVAVHAAKDVVGDALGAQRWSVRGQGTESPAPEKQGRYQVILDMVKNFHRIGVVVQGTAIGPGDAGPLGADRYLEVQSLLDDSGDPTPPFPQTATR